MKFYLRSLWLILTGSICFLLIFSSCDDMVDKPHNGDFDISEPVRFYVLSEGLFNNNNSTLAFYDLENKVKNSDYFQTWNHRGLGDTANDALIYGSKMYIVVNVSGVLEVLDIQSGKSIKQIKMQNEAGVNKQPRFMTAHQNKIYICSFDGTVSRLDTLSIQIEATIPVGKNPDGICCANGKIYVSNSGGLSFPNYENTVSVIDIQSFTVHKTLTVGTNPYKLIPDSQGDVYVVSRGNYGTVKSCLCKINPDLQVQFFDTIPVSEFGIYQDTAYLYHFDLNSNFMKWVKFDCKKEEVINTWQSNKTLFESPNGMDINPENGDIYVTDAKSYTVLGDVFCFNNKGKLKFRLQEVGLNPKKVIFF